MEKVLYKKLSYNIVGCFYKVYNTLGPGHKEDIYHRALEIEFNNEGINFESEKRIKLEYEGKKIGTYQLDFAIEGKIVIEIKSVAFLPKVFEKQLYYYLRASGYKLGYLVNFGSDKLNIIRRVLGQINS
ncbi:MAG: GxxExxY protein [Candidatus Omnitrophica bacterium]|nr:GxxExxY protein [Candidatus Omnitrophota bacterium]MDD5430546.1 GxxExxY protein [Candidatus Omnitrophota bacterium]